MALSVEGRLAAVTAEQAFAKMTAEGVSARDAGHRGQKEKSPRHAPRGTPGRQWLATRHQHKSGAARRVGA